MSNEKRSVSRRNTVIRLMKYVLRYKWLVLSAIALVTVSNLMALTGPKLAGLAIDAIGIKKGGVDFEKVIRYCVMMVVFYVLSSMLGYLLQRIMIYISKKIAYTMRKEVFNHLLELPAGYFDTRQTGDIISNLTYDIDTVNASLSNDLIQIATTMFTVSISFVMMFTISKPLVLVTLISIPASILFAGFRLRVTKPLFRKRAAKLGELNGYAEEMLSGQKTIQAYGREDYILGRFHEKNIEAVNAYYNADYQGSVVGPSVNFINNLSISLISMFGAFLYLSGGLTLGNLSSFMTYSRKFSGPISEIANIASELQSAVSAAERIFRVLDAAPEKSDAPDAVELENVRGDVEFEHVRFGYEADKTIIHDLSVKIPAGKVVAIVGPTGAGKTTIINLLMRFYDVESGRILIDGHEIDRIKRKSLRKAFTMVLQDTWLFQGTIYENLKYGNENVTRELVEKVIAEAHIDTFIHNLPDGLDTVLNDEGVNISKGQKQLLTIARAMLSEAKMLILDEATSNVDSRTEILIQDAMLKLMQGKTCFVIAHRLSTIENADMILVVKDGDVVETGTHTELLAKNGVYAEMYFSQYQ